MISYAENYYQVFVQCIRMYHTCDDVNAAAESPYAAYSFRDILFRKCWIDTVQWHLEDIIREPSIHPPYALAIKRRIDALNQERTNMVEKIDDWFVVKYQAVDCLPYARHNTESIGWAIDRLSILALKIYHIDAELTRDDITPAHLEKCWQRKNVLDNQLHDLLCAINWLIEDIASGKLKMKIYRQMKMYNEVEFNPVLYKGTVKEVVKQ